MKGARPGDPRRSGKIHAGRIRAGMRRPSVGVPQARRHLSVEHSHTCVKCRNAYTCKNACDPIGEGLDASLCTVCFEEA